MLRNTLFYIFFLITLSSTWGQQSPCMVETLHERAFQDPILRQHHADWEDAASSVLSRKPVGQQHKGISSTVIPVVFHLVHQNGPENLSRAQVEQALAWLNEAFANSGTFDRGGGADTGIRFCLAQRTPDGKATDGITRTQSALTDLEVEKEDGTLKNLVRWNPVDYLNIWLVREACSSTYGCNLVGYAYYPAFHGTLLDGVVMEARWLTNAATISPLAHEVGHYLGLYHTFEGGCANGDCLREGDRVCDTPPDNSRAGIPCEQRVNTCSTDTQSGLTADADDPTTNHMDYGPYACMHDFTLGQADRMVFSLNGIRKSLLRSKGCLPPCLVPAIALFTPKDTTIAAGNSILFENKSQNAGRSRWSVDGVLFSAQTNPIRQFTQPGTFKVTLNAIPADTILCGVSGVTGTVRVVCEAKAQFTLSPLYVRLGAPVVVQNNSLAGLQAEWFVNGQPKGSQLDTVRFSTSGTQVVTLRVSNGFCADSLSISVLVETPDPANCPTYQQIFPLRPDSTYLSLGHMAVLSGGDLLVAAGLSKVSINGSNVFTADRREAMLMLFKADGTPAWEKRLAASTHKYFIEALAAARDGGFYLLMYAVEPNNRQPLMLVKYRANGTQQWAKTIEDGTNVLYAVFHRKTKGLWVGDDNSVVVAGEMTSSNGAIASVAFGALKYDASGQLLWKQQVPRNGYNFSFISGLPNGAYIMGSVREAPLQTRYWHLDATGGLTRITYNDDHRCEGLVPAPDGNLYAFGSYFGQGWLAKVNLNLGIIWSKKYKNTDNNNIRFQDVVLEGQRLYIGASYIGKGGAFLVLDLEGGLIYAKSHFSNTGRIEQMIPTGLGGYWMCGSLSLSTLPYAPTSPAFWTIKADRNGGVINCSNDLADISVETATTLFRVEQMLLPFSGIETGDGFAVAAVEDDYKASPPLCGALCTVPEICNNGLDDDGDNLVDCFDPGCSCPPAPRCAPKRANVWYFDRRRGLDFSEDPPAFLTDGETQSLRPTATISDVRGDLLFYSDGIHVYDRFHKVMPNGILNNPPPSVTGIECVIVPNPALETQYYLISFSVDGTRLVSTLIDMSRNGGRGDVVPGQKNLPLVSGTPRGLAAVRACAENAYWVVTYVPDVAFFVFKFREGGIDVVPTGAPLSGPTGFVQLKFSPNALRLAALNAGAAAEIVFYDFDSASGQITNGQTILPNGSGAGVEFSPTGRMAYLSVSAPSGSRLLQYDLESGDWAAVRASGVMLASSGTVNAFGQMQLAPNGNILIAYSKVSSLGGGATVTLFSSAIIHKPNLRGTACELETGATFSTSRSWCNLIASDLGAVYAKIDPNIDTLICGLGQPQTYRTTRLGCNVDSVSWRLEGIVADLVPQEGAVRVTYRGYGEGFLILNAFNDCGTSADTLRVKVVAPNTQKLNIGPDRLVCDNGVTTFRAGGGFARYRWNTGLGDSVLTTLQPGKYWVDVWDACGQKQSDTVEVRIRPGTVLELGTDPRPCRNERLVYQRPAQFRSWTWTPRQGLDCDTCKQVGVALAKNGTFVVIATDGAGCLSVDTLTILPRDTAFRRVAAEACKGRPAVFYGQPLLADTTAVFFLPAPGGIGCDSLVTVDLRALQTPTVVQRAVICPETYYNYRGALLPPDTVAFFFHPSGTLACDTFVTVETRGFPRVSVEALPGDTAVFIGAEVSLSALAQGVGLVRYAWSPPDGLTCTDCEGPTAQPLTSTRYQVRATDANGCSAEAEVSVAVQNLCVDMVPNAFTPNGDDLNEWFYPLTHPCVKRVLRWTVSNRWGQKMFDRLDFAPNRPELGWDGTADGTEQPMDTYVWFAEFLLYDGKKVAKKGDVALVR